MESQAKKISGYRDLTFDEISLINEIKAEGERLGELVQKTMMVNGVDARAAAIGKTELQTGIMWLVRAIARPESF